MITGIQARALFKESHAEKIHEVEEILDKKIQSAVLNARDSILVEMEDQYEESIYKYVSNINGFTFTYSLSGPRIARISGWVL